MLGVFVPVIFAILLTAVFSYKRIIWLAVFLTPLSIQLEELYYGLPFDMAIPTEPLLFGILILFAFSLAQGHRLDRKVTTHPVALAIYFYLGWIALTSVSSTLPLVSVKYLLVRIWYIVVFFFLMTYLFRNQKKMEQFVWLFTIAFIPVIIYTIFRHIQLGLHDNNAAHWVMDPFFNDHTSYGAVLAMLIPFLLGFAFAKWIKPAHKVWVWGLLLFFIVAEILSFSRAAWLSLFAALGVWVILKLKIRFKTLAITAISLLLIVFAFQKQILMKLEQNSTDSSNNLMEHLNSMTNISTDASNLERINRWQCAIAMFREKPFLGWGPGTYAMSYASFQLTSQRTIISTNAGDGGNAHSEYLGALAEMGFVGMLSFIVLVIVVFYTAVRAYSRTSDKRIKTILMSAMLGLFTYYIHAFLNNFLDTDKAAVPFWGFTAMIVVLDIYTREQQKLPPEKALSDDSVL